MPAMIRRQMLLALPHRQGLQMAEHRYRPRLPRPCWVNIDGKKGVVSSVLANTIALETSSRLDFSWKYSYGVADNNEMADSCDRGKDTCRKGR